MRARLAGLLIGALAARAEAAPKIAVLTMTPGPLLFERFGHSAIRVDQRVYNFGTFDANDPALVRKFLARRLTYWLSVDSWDDHQRRYANREITVQELALDDRAAVALAAALEDNARPEHRASRYYFFLDNCSTRVRDAVDRASGGALATAGRAPSPHTWREQVVAVLGGGALARGVSLLLNGTVDEPRTRWEASFLPSELERLLADARDFDGRPLVAASFTIPARSRFAAPARRGDRSLLLLALPLVLAAPMARHRAGRITAGIAVLVGALAAALLGAAMLVGALTSYPCARGNPLSLSLSPALFALAPIGLRLATGRIGARARRRGLLACAILAVPCLLFAVGRATGLVQARQLDAVAAVALLIALTAVALRRA